MNYEIIIVLIIISVAVALFISEKFSVDTVAILIMILLMVTGILTPEEGFQGFSNPATLTVGAMFVISASIFRTGALNGVGTLLTRIGKKNYMLCLIFIIFFSAFLSAFINDTAVVALLMPIVIQVAVDSKISPSKLLMPLSFGALLGGVCTLIGTSTNILVSGIAERMGEKPIGMFEMTSAGAIFLIAGAIYLILIGNKLLPNRRAVTNMIEEFSMGEYFSEIVILPESTAVGQLLSEINLVQDLDVKVIEVRRKNGLKLQADPNIEIKPQDILKVLCELDKLKKLKDLKGIEIKNERKYSDSEDADQNRKLIEVVVTPYSYLEGKTLKEVRFRYIYSAPVLAIRHREGILENNLAHATLHAGDILLISADKDQILQLKNSRNLLVISEKDTSEFRYTKIIPSLLIIIGVITSAAFNIAPIVLSATIGSVLLILFRVINVDEAYRAIEWKVIFMLAGVLSMGTALEKTGAAKLISEGLVETIGQFGPRALLSVFFLLTFLLTNFMSNNATAALLAPIAIVTAKTMGVEARPLLMAVTFAASLSFMTPIGYQTNTMVYGPGNYRFKDYLKVGTPLNLLLWILATIIIPLIFPF